MKEKYKLTLSPTDWYVAGTLKGIELPLPFKGRFSISLSLVWLAENNVYLYVRQYIRPLWKLATKLL